MTKRYDEIHRLLTEAFSPEHLAVENESDSHAGPPGRESHFRVRVVSAAFEGKNLVARHRLVNAALASLLTPKGIHALAIEAYTPAQWTARNAVGQESPDCAGNH